MKNADAVLKKVPGYGPALSMKALAMWNLAGANARAKEEAFELAKAGLKADLKSYVCWHVFGSLHLSSIQRPQSMLPRRLLSASN